VSKKHSAYLLANGKPAPSVTTILSLLNKPALNDWRAALGKKRTEEITRLAADFGSAVHAGIEAVCSEGQVPHYTHPRLKAAIDNFQLWADKNVRRWIVFEKAVYHDDLGYAGTIDAIAELHSGKIVLVDFKTSKKIRWEYYLQTVAYARAQRIEDDCFDMSLLEGIIIVHLVHDTMTWEAVHVNNSDDTWSLFCYLCALYPHWKDANA